MRNWILSAGLILLGILPLAAQQRAGNAQERVRAMKVAFITERMQLTPDEAEKFWPLQNEYEAEQRKIREKYRPDRELSALSDAEVERLLFGMLEMEEELLKLRRDYIAKFRRVVSVRKVAIYFRAEMDFNRRLLQTLQNKRN